MRRITVTVNGVRHEADVEEREHPAKALLKGRLAAGRR